MLTALLPDPHPQTRRAAVAALRFGDDSLLRNTYPLPSGAYPYMTPEEQKRWHKAFLDTVFPAVALRLDDDAGEVRLAAAQTMEYWTYFPDAPWPLALGPLARAASAPDPALRLAALRTFWVSCPATFRPAAPALRAALRGDEAGLPWALAALSHAAWTGRARTLDAFLTDLSRPRLWSQRRAAAADLRLTAGLLWGGGFQHNSYPVLRWWNDSRLFRVSSAPDATAPASQDSSAGLPGPCHRRP